MNFNSICEARALRAVMIAVDATGARHPYTLHGTRVDLLETSTAATHALILHIEKMDKKIALI